MTHDPFELSRFVRTMFGTPDDLKFRSSMTLFSIAATGESSVFHRALDRWCSGLPDPATLRLLRSPDASSPVG